MLLEVWAPLKDGDLVNLAGSSDIFTSGIVRILSMKIDP